MQCEFPNIPMCGVVDHLLPCQGDLKIQFDFCNCVIAIHRLVLVPFYFQLLWENVFVNNEN